MFFHKSVASCPRTTMVKKAKWYGCPNLTIWEVSFSCQSGLALLWQHVHFQLELEKPREIQNDHVPLLDAFVWWACWGCRRFLLQLRWKSQTWTTWICCQLFAKAVFTLWWWWKRLKPRKSAATHGVVEETQTMSRGLARTFFVSENCLLFHR